MSTGRASGSGRASSAGIASDAGRASDAGQTVGTLQASGSDRAVGAVQTVNTRRATTESQVSSTIQASGTKQEVLTIPATKRHITAGGQLAAARQIRVAAYCRVSTDETSQQTSYATQCRYYTDLISRKPEWSMAGLYADEAISGTSRAKRREFNRMMDDARVGKIDYIITKSISRFARNTVDTLECVRELRSQEPPVGVFFEKESVDSLDAKGELLLTILSALAQDESRSISDNIRWSFQKKFQAGIPQINLRQMLGYDKDENGNWIINEPQAEIVRYIYRRCLEGCSARKIADELNQAQMTTINGCSWRANTVLFILQNEKYVGDLEMQKNITVDFLTHQSHRNNGIAPKYYVRNHHEGIIDRFTWDKVQAIFRGRRDKNRAQWLEVTAEGETFQEVRVNGEINQGEMDLKTPEEKSPEKKPLTDKSTGLNTLTDKSTGLNTLTDKSSGLTLSAEEPSEQMLSNTSYDNHAGKAAQAKAASRHPLYNLTCANCGGAYRRYGYTGLAIDYEDERSADLSEEERSGYKEIYSYIYRVWRCETKYKGHEKKHGTLSEKERAAFEQQCSSPILYEIAVEQSFMEMLYCLKREYEQLGEECSFAQNFRAACAKVKRLCGRKSGNQKYRDHSYSQTGDSYSNDMDLYNQNFDAGIGNSAAGQRTCGMMEHNYTLFLQCLEALPETNRAGMPLRVFRRDVTETDSAESTAEADHTDMSDLDHTAMPAPDHAAKVPTGHDPEAVDRIVSVNLDHTGMTAPDHADPPLKKHAAKTLTDRVAEAPDFLEFDKGIYQAFFPRAVVCANTIDFITNFGIKFTCKGITRSLSSFLGFRRANADGSVELLTQNWQVNGSCIQYRRKKRIYQKRKQNSNEE